MEEEAEFKAYAAQPNLHERIFAKVAPNIFGHADIKKAVACLLFGGARKVWCIAVTAMLPLSLVPWHRILVTHALVLCCVSCILSGRPALHTEYTTPLPNNHVCILSICSTEM